MTIAKPALSARATLALLLLCTAIGAGLRFWDLAARPPWTDEVSTFAFSLGNGFDVPLDLPISTETLLAPLRPNPEAGFGQVAERLRAESTHPPLYFWLSHAWLRFFPPNNGGLGPLASLWGGRSLAALLGVLAIPAAWGAGSLLWRSRGAGLGAAAAMAISPLAIFLARDARHYTLAILCVLGSLTCFGLAMRAIARRQIFSWRLGIAWLAFNSLGMVAHFFVCFSFVAQGLACLEQGRSQWRELNHSAWRRLGWVALGTLASALVWLPQLGSVSGHPATRWAYESEPLAEFWLQPLQLTLWLMSVLTVTPLGPTVSPIATIAVGMLQLGFWVWVLLQIGRVIPWDDPAARALGVYTVVLPTLFLVLAYAGLDLTQAPRFNFVWLPAIVLLAGVALVRLPPRAIALALCIPFLGAGIAASDAGYLQNQRADHLAPVLGAGSPTNPAIIVFAHEHHGQTGRAISLAWALGDRLAPQYVLLDRLNAGHDGALENLKQALSRHPRPFDLWLVDFRVAADLESWGCRADRDYWGWAGEYRYRLYRCR